MDVQNSVPIPRNRIFVLIDGTFAVQWAENQVQDLLSGKYSDFSREQFGSEITDYEINQLVITGLVEKYDNELVYLSATPHITPMPKRSYYLNTVLSDSDLNNVQTTLDDLDLIEHFTARVRDNFVVIWGRNGLPFRRFDDAEKARELLAVKAPGLFGATVVAFIETTE
jgi:hypothetical protein